ncbi:PREDICTED: tumor necrosis factor ligand superfamily member 18 [Condylura cristata]|uniref:tumor necrosis factor ligand superfamily member 18 n=1 Tax=Condylura cristata TaxID=143302 RepID=UPI0003347EF5|nr:PREDICTED: tumor necrosis factor ligand superfamily member 18 [Condylura cristata]
MENMTLNHATPQEAQRPTWKQWFLYSTIIILLLLCSFITLILNFLPCKPPSEPCVAQFGPLPSKWQMSSPEFPCMDKRGDWKLRILRKGSYLIYGQVAPNTTYQEKAPFEVQLLKNEDIIQTVTDKSKIQYVGWPGELHAEDTIDLMFNGEHQVLENNTYLKVFLIENITLTS